MIDQAVATLDFVELKREIKAVDLSLNAARKRQSPRTGFVHFFPTDDSASDTIPVFENFCFVLALFRQKTAEAVLEGKELIDRLLAFQAPGGNFPVFLHDYPRCWDKLMPLKIAPILRQILRQFSSVLNVEIKVKIDSAIAKGLKFIDEPSLSPLWSHRYFCLLNQSSSFIPVSAEEWFETLISDQLVSSVPLHVGLPYHKKLQSFIGNSVAQEKGEPRPVVVEWLCAESQGYSERLLRDHPHQIYASLLFPFSVTEQEESSFVFTPQPSGLRLLWGGSKLHSFTIPFGQVMARSEAGARILFDFEQMPEFGRGDLFEVLAFCDLSPEVRISIEGKKGTVFSLGDKVWIHTPSLQIEATFTLLEGVGDFCGQISRANRPSQTACQKALLYEVFDWQIGLRTWRRSTPCRIQLELTCSG